MVEFVLVSMIAGIGLTAGQALSAVLAYRAVNFWLPIPFGGLAYGSLELQRWPSYHRVRVHLHRRRGRHGGAAPGPAAEADQPAPSADGFSDPAGTSAATTTG